MHVVQGRKWLHRSEGQVVMEVVMRRDVTTGGAFYPASPSLTPLSPYYEDFALILLITLLNQKLIGSKTHYICPIDEFWNCTYKHHPDA